MVYRPKKHRGGNTILGIVIGIIITVCGIYVYDNYKPQLQDSINQIKNTAITEVQKTEPIMRSIKDKVVSEAIPASHTVIAEISKTSPLKTEIDVSEKISIVSDIQKSSSTILRSFQTQPSIATTNNDQSGGQQPVISQPVIIQQVIDTNTIAKELHTLINLQRTSNGLKALSWDNNLAQIATAHSNDMIKNNYFTHNDLQGHDPSYRLTCNNPRENIAWTDGFSLEQVANKMTKDWMGSQVHRENILNSISANEGIGIAINGNHVVATEDFC
jgi:uncharacterized protein YkwD